MRRRFVDELINPVFFWVIATLTVVPALALLFARKAVHVAVSVALVMVSLAAAYISLGAPFLGIVQIVVYTGAIMMLFVFVVMLVGVDRRESMKETIKGQRWIAFFMGAGLLLLLISAVSQTSIFVKPVVEGTPEALAKLLYSDYVLVLEVLAAALITAAVGALLLTHVPRLLPKRTQPEIAAARIKAGANPVNRPMPGVFARHNALDVAALDPEGNPIEESISRVLKVRNQLDDADEYRADLPQNRMIDEEYEGGK